MIRKARLVANWYMRYSLKIWDNMVTGLSETPTWVYGLMGFTVSFLISRH